MPPTAPGLPAHRGAGRRFVRMIVGLAIVVLASLTVIGALHHEPTGAQGAGVEAAAAVLGGEEHASPALSGPEAAGCALLVACCVLLVAVRLTRGRAAALSLATDKGPRQAPLVAFLPPRPPVRPPSLVALSISRT